MYWALYQILFSILTPLILREISIIILILKIF